MYYWLEIENVSEEGRNGIRGAGENSSFFCTENFVIET